MERWSRTDLEQIHKASIRHRERIERSTVCGCFYCLATYAPVEITEWADGPSEEEELATGVTGLCARCGIDAVLPDDVPGAPICPELLSIMHHYFFERRVESSLRWAWGNAYSFACALRTWFDKKTLDGRKLECGPPSQPAEGQASRS